MTICCPIGPALDFAVFAGDLAPWITTHSNGAQELDLIVPGITAAADILLIERELGKLADVQSVRVNYSGKRVATTWNETDFKPVAIMEKLNDLGFVSRPFDPSHSGLKTDDEQSRSLLRAVAVSGFAAGNIMLLSVSVWSGADGSLRDFFHWISAGIALPTVAYAGRPFFRSAVRALSSGQFNMDVPISLAVCLAALMSLYETFNHGEVAYFDASVTLLFFLLTGRYLDQLMRARARSAVSQLLSLAASSAIIETGDGQTQIVAATALRPKMKMLVAVGERLAADGVVEGGSSDVDRSLLTGETNPELVSKGSSVHAGMLNLTGPLVVSVTAAGTDTFLSEIIRLMSMAEQSRSRYVQIADRLARIYSPAVHILAALTLIGWLIWTGGDWHGSLMTAIAVLIITCPCALGLAVPAVQTVASGVLFRNKVMIRDGAALEKLAGIDTVIFDKTGTLTLGRPRLADGQFVAPANLALAAGLAKHSHHPLSRAVYKAATSRGVAPLAVDDVQELPGCGLSGQFCCEPVRLGSRKWCGLPDTASNGLPEFVLVHGKNDPVVFAFEDELRPDAGTVIEKLKHDGLRLEILSGDRQYPVGRLASALGIEIWQAGVTPQGKLSHIQSLKEAGHKVLVVGDGLNDAPALAAGHTSIAPSSASDVGRTAADTVFTGDSLQPIATALDVARATHRLTVQNFALAVAYNIMAVPIAMLGFATPLVAAIAMSTSSIIVVANSLRLGLSFPQRLTRPKFAASQSAQTATQFEGVPA